LFTPEKQFIANQTGMKNNHGGSKNVEELR